MGSSCRGSKGVARAVPAGADDGEATPEAPTVGYKTPWKDIDDYKAKADEYKKKLDEYAQSPKDAKSQVDAVSKALGLEVDHGEAGTGEKGEDEYAGPPPVLLQP